MHRFLKILMVTILTFFTIPFGGLSALAQGEGYENIEEGTYEIGVLALEKDSDEQSAANDFLIHQAQLKVKEEQILLTLSYTKDFDMEYGINDTTFNGQAPIDQREDDQGFHYTFKLDQIQNEYSASMNYYVPGMPGDMGDQEKGHNVNYRIVLDQEDLNALPVKQESDEGEDEEVVDEDEDGQENEETDGKEDEEVEGEDEESKEEEEQEASDELIQNPDETYTVVYQTDTPMIERYFDNPATLVVKDGKKYIQIDGNSKQFIKSLTINDEEVTWGKIAEDGTYTFQFELPGELSQKLDFGMVIDTGNPQFGEMTHVVELWFVQKIDANTPTSVKAGETYVVLDGHTVTMPRDLPTDVTVKVSEADDVNHLGSLEVAGGPVTFDFENLEKYKGSFELTMAYDDETFNEDDYDVDLYYYNEANEAWEAQKGTIDNGKVTAEVEHFSTYGVLAKKVEEEVEDSDLPVDLPKDAEKVDYVILHENGKEVSTADSFFQKPGYLFEVKGNKYVQVTVDNADMIKALSSEYGEAAIVEHLQDGSMIVQLPINQDLSDTPLKMKIEVPGMYSQEHKALLSIKQDEGGKEEEEKEKEKDEESTKDESEKTPKPKDQSLVPDKAYEINYTIYHEDGQKVSIADDFFLKPALLLEKDGKKYAHLTITDGQMVRELKNKYGNALIVKENSDGSIVVQLRVNNDLSDMILDMHIVVPEGAIPGFPGYDEKHRTILSFDQASLKEVDVKDHKLVGTKNAENDNGPYVENGQDSTPTKPEFGEVKEGEGKGTGGKEKDIQNPKTGDTSKILLYSLLLIGSFIPLAIKLRRRFA